MSTASESTLALVRALAEQGFWGVLSLKFQHGEVIHITKEESLQPNQLEPKYRRTNDYQHSNRSN